LAVHPVQTFGDVENDVGPDLPESLRKILFRLQADDFSKAGERRFNGGDRGGAVPLGKLVPGD